MDGRRTCEGCSAVIVKPIVCSLCGAAAHPGCVARNGHPNYNRRFTNCSDVSTASQGVPVNLNDSSVFLDTIKELIKSEFEDFRREMRELYQADMTKRGHSESGKPLGQP